jgi:Family of unknown function (DUF5681)
MYEIGKGRPPRHTRFQPGTSGNPSGRPKGCSFKTELMKELSELIEIGDDKHRTSMSKQRAIIIALLREAMGGDLRAIDTVMRACLPMSQQDNDEVDAPEDRAIIDTLEASTKQQKSKEGEQ